MSISVNLGPHFEKLVRDLLSEGRFQNASEVIRAGLRLLEDHESLQREREQRLLADLQEGRDSPRATGSLDEMIARGKARLRKKHTKKG